MTSTVSREQFIDAMVTAGLDPEEALRENYSGRFMYGRTCLGVTCDAGQFALLCASLGSNADDWDFVGGVRTDDMGLSTIWYWPGITLERKRFCPSCGSADVRRATTVWQCNTCHAEWGD